MGDNNDSVIKKFISGVRGRSKTIDNAVNKNRDLHTKEQTPSFEKPVVPKNMAKKRKEEPMRSEDEEIDENDFIRAKVLYDFQPRADDEIPLKIGQTVFIFHKHESGWWTGECSARYGLFPADYVLEDAAEKAKKKLGGTLDPTRNKLSPPSVPVSSKQSDDNLKTTATNVHLGSPNSTGNQNKTSQNHTSPKAIGNEKFHIRIRFCLLYKVAEFS